MPARRILVIDDADDVRNVTQLSLERMGGWTVSTARSGIEGIAKAIAEQPEAILLDVMMPDMDGYETMGLIRKSTKHRLLPILALTAKAMKGDREKCLEAGASDYIAKPVNTEELLGLLRIWLFGKQTHSGVGYERSNGEHPRS